MSDQLLALIIALFGGAGATAVTNWLTRPKTKADAGLAVATGEVAMSGDAREWARVFASEAKEAKERADRAEQRCDDIERRFGLLVDYTRTLQREINSIDGHQVPAPPAELIPPL